MSNVYLYRFFGLKKNQLKFIVKKLKKIIEE